MSEIFLPKIIKICQFFKLWLIMPGMFFSGFLLLLMHISLDLLSPGSAKAYIGWGGKLNGRLMWGFVRNIRTKNDQNLIISFQVTAKNVGDVFWDTVYFWHTITIMHMGLSQNHDEQWKEYTVQRRSFWDIRHVRNTYTPMGSHKYWYCAWFWQHY